MSSVQCLREFVNERLTAAAEDIFRVFEQTIVEYEEEIDRQRRLLDIVWKPEIKLHRTELPQQHVCKEEELLPDQERNPSLDREDPEPPQIKEEQEELCTSPEGQQLVLKQIHTFMLTSTCEGRELREPEPIGEHQLLPHTSPGAESREQTGSEQVDSGSTSNKRRHRDHVDNCPPTQSPCNTHTGQQTLMCDTCGKIFLTKSKLNTHVRLHTGERPFSCDTCGKAFLCRSRLTLHLRVHTGERPYSCDFCGQTFSRKVHLEEHVSRHTGERPFFCKLCGKNYKQRSALRVHMRVHTGERPFSCDLCQKTFLVKTNLLVHMRLHTGEKPCVCNTCGRSFIYPTSLRKHIRIHAEETPLVPHDAGEIPRVVVN